jgi:hypothetical protein
MIYITGDTHGPTPIGMHSVDGFGKRLNKENFPEQKEMTREDYVIICGDFGGIWNYDSRYDRAGSSFREKICLDHGESKEEKYWLDWLSEKPFTVLFCDGNHENHDRLSGAYPEEDFCGGRVHRIRDNVFHLMRGYVFDLQGFSFFVFGGARSHDISDGILRPCEFQTEKEFKEAYRRLQRRNALFRVDHVSWWEAELPTGEEMERGIRNLKERSFYADFIVSHCAPSSVAAAAGYDGEDRLSRYLEEIRQRTGFRKWFFGHYHENRMVSGKYVMLYEQIVRIC